MPLNKKDIKFYKNLIQTTVRFFFYAYYQSILQLYPVTVGHHLPPYNPLALENRSSLKFCISICSPRNIDIWLPEGYADQKKYEVIYMHDGQMLFDSSNTWNKQSWEVDDVMSRLLSSSKIRDAIVVGIWNGGETRHIAFKVVY